MKDKSEKLISQKAKDDATMNFVSRQAQEVILDPNLPEAYKDEVLGAAVGTILRIAERKIAYNSPRRENRQIQEPRTIYDSRDEEERPEVISEINGYMGEDKVEEIAEGLGVHRKTLYEWLREDEEFAATFGRVKAVQTSDQFTTGTDMDKRVNAMAIAMLLMEKRDQRDKDKWK